MGEEQEADKTAGDHQFLDLTLGLGRQPLNADNSVGVGKREQQAMRSQEAKAKRRRQDVVVAGRERPRRGNAGVGYKEGHNCHFSSSSVSTAASSAVSGGNSSDTSSHSSHYQYTDSPVMNLPTQSSTPKQPTSPHREHTPSTPCNHNYSQPQLHSSSNQTHLVTNSNNQPSIPMTNEAKIDLGKPPKPNGHTPSKESGLAGLAPQMPCVTATGNGPKGRTITGFLYKYTKTEVSIVCVCHGASFSPAGFVEHAGGVDVEHPLKHIRVAPYPLS